MSEYNMSHTGQELDDAINRVQSGYILPNGTLDITENGTHDARQYENVNVNVPAGTDTSDATAGIYDIYEGQTAYVNGEKITGAYEALGFGATQYNANSPGCSTSRLVVPCDFTPKGCCVVLNSGTYANNRIIAVWSRVGGTAVYHSKTSSGVARTEITNDASYIYYDAENKQLVINAASSSYLWGTNNYRVFVFR